MAATAQAQDTNATASETVRRAIHLCNACHGDEGRSKEAVNPSLAGQMPQYFQQQLKDFRSQSRSEANLTAYMWGVSALLDDATIQGLAEYYAGLSPKPGHPGKPRLLATGKKLFEQGIPSRGIKACAGCHGDNAEGEAGFPRLAGQQAGYLTRQLKMFRTTPLRRHGVLMKAESRPMNDAEVRAVAAYLQSR
jgi:cytochrome c553